jgi:hypothetical protein
MKSANSANASKFARFPRFARNCGHDLRLVRAVCLVILIGLLVSSSYWSSSASLVRKSTAKNLTPTASVPAFTVEVSEIAKLPVWPSSLRTGNYASLMMLPQAPLPITVTTYAGDCTTAKSVFNVQDNDKTVCAKVTGSHPGWVIIWSNANSVAVQNVPIGSGESTFTLSTASSLGDWRVIAYEPIGGSVYGLSTFTVVDAANPSADLSISDNGVSGTVASGGQAAFGLQVNNYGPSDAAGVELTGAIPANATFVSFVQLTGPTFNCTNPAVGDTLGSSDCTIASLGRGESATFLATYVATGASGSLISHTGSVSSTTTTDPKDVNNSSTAELSVKGVEGETCTVNCPDETCTLACPVDITVTADATSGGVSGAFVNYGAASGTGNCGAISNSPAAGSFFAVGSHVITSAATGASCTFTLTVLDTAPPTISCPADIATTVDEGSDTAIVDPGTPTTTPSGITVVGERSDGLALDAPYPLGTTGIRWTATDAARRRVACKQAIIVNGSACDTDTTAPTITAPEDVTVATGVGNTACAVALDDELGQVTADDNCSFKVTISGLPAGNVFPVGTTTLTYRATDQGGNYAEDIQVVTVVEDTPPSIAAPPDATYVCPSEVPAASASQATRGEVLDEDGSPLPPGPPFDNCSTPTVTVTESNNGGEGSASNPLIITRVFTATDSATPSNSASATQTITVADGVAPTITAPSDATYQCASEVPAGDASQASTSDNCAASVITLSESSNGGTGTTSNPLVITRTFTATDAANNSASAVQVITVSDTTAPIIALNGPNSVDVECNTSYTDAGATATDNCSGSFAVTPSGTVDANTVGSYTITYNATDAAGNAAIPVVRTVNVVDTTAPAIEFNSLTLFFNNWTFVFNANTVTVNGTTYPYNGASFTHGDFSFSFNGQTMTITNDGQSNTYTLEGKTLVFWTPFHQYQTVNVNDLIQSAGDSCDSGVNRDDVVISQVTSDEPANTVGSDDGHTLTDIVISPDCKSVQLRAERAGSGNGRFYTITSKVTDAAGNITTVTSTVRVRRYPFQAAVDSGPQYSITGSCP